MQPARRSLPIAGQQPSSLAHDGRRLFVYPADVSGRFWNVRRVAFALLIAIYVVTPWIDVGGHPAVFLDIEHRRFYLFGGTFNAQDFWLVFFLLTGVGFLLIFLTTVLGRVWCGYACPQTVFLEGVYRRLERWIEGPREARMRLARSPWTVGKIAKKTLKHAAYAGVSIFVAHVFLSYFVSLPAMFEMVQESPAEHPEAFAWAFGISAVMYVNFAFLREQLCLIVCPYGRLQSALTDADTINVGYDARRGEPRGKKTDESAGDCVDCYRCVTVCPTGIDIRNGPQLDCIGCSACIDACDDIMDKLGRERGLIRYDSEKGFAGEKKRMLRPRIFVYALLGAVGLVVATFAFRSHTSFEANLLRLPGPPFTLDSGEIRNGFEIHLVNKSPDDATFELTPRVQPPLELVVPSRTVRLRSLEDRRIPVFVTAPASAVRGSQPIRLEIEMKGSEDPPRVVDAQFLAPGG